MNISKTLALGAVAALSIGVGSAMAQSSAVSPGNYGVPAAAPQASAPAVTQYQQQRTVQYGSSDHGFTFDTDPIAGGF
jgi:hypothetical protein